MHELQQRMLAAVQLAHEVREHFRPPFGRQADKLQPGLFDFLLVERRGGVADAVPGLAQSAAQANEWIDVAGGTVGS